MHSMKWLLFVIFGANSHLNVDNFRVEKVVVVSALLEMGF